MRGAQRQPERVRSKEAAAILGVPLTTLRCMVDRADFPGIAKIGGLWTFDIKALHRFKQKRDAESATKNAPVVLRDTVYVVRCGYNIKIGYTNNLKARLRVIQTSNAHDVEVLATFDGTKAGERMLHEKFKEFHARGEWFYDRREIRSWANRHRGALP